MMLADRDDPHGAFPAWKRPRRRPRQRRARRPRVSCAAPVCRWTAGGWKPGGNRNRARDRLVLTIVFTLVGIHTNQQNDRLRNDGVPVTFTVAGCLGLLGGSGSNAAGYSCHGDLHPQREDLLRRTPGAIYPTGPDRRCCHRRPRRSGPGLAGCTGGEGTLVGQRVRVADHPVRRAAPARRAPAGVASAASGLRVGTSPARSLSGFGLSHGYGRASGRRGVALVAARSRCGRFVVAPFGRGAWGPAASARLSLLLQSPGPYEVPGAGQEERGGEPEVGVVELEDGQAVERQGDALEHPLAQP